MSGCDTDNGPCSCGAWHSPNSLGTTRIVMDDLESAQQKMSEKQERLVKAFFLRPEKLVPITPVRKCDECSGTGFWDSPISGRRSPCSRGCRP